MACSLAGIKKKKSELCLKLSALVYDKGESVFYLFFIYFFIIFLRRGKLI